MKRMVDVDTKNKWSWIQRLKTGSAPSQLIMMALLVSVTVYLCIKFPYFPTWGNIRNIIDHSALNAIIAVGMTFVICSAGFLLGGINGLVISLFKVNPFIVTLATMSVIRGLALILTGGIPFYNFSNGFTWWGSGHIGPFNPLMLLALFAIFEGAVMLNRTRFGYHVPSIGGNEEALRRTGVNTVIRKTLVYGFCGLMGAIGGLIITARLNTAEPLTGTMIELEAIATVVLGGTAMNGGKGTIVGTVLASLLLGVLRNGLVILSISSYYQQLLIGLIILSVVIVSEVNPRS